MYLHLKLCELDFWLKISNVRMTADGDDWSVNWCNVELRLQSEYINYNNSGELLLSGEVLHIKISLEELLNGLMQKAETFKSCEPDLMMNFIPAKEEVRCEFVIRFWDGREPRNSLVMTLDKQEIEALLVYLKLVTNEIDEKDMQVVKLREREILVKY